MACPRGTHHLVGRREVEGGPWVVQECVQGSEWSMGWAHVVRLGSDTWEGTGHENGKVAG